MNLKIILSILVCSMLFACSQNDELSDSHRKNSSVVIERVTQTKSSNGETVNLYNIKLAEEEITNIKLSDEQVELLSRAENLNIVSDACVGKSDKWIYRDGGNTYKFGISGYLDYGGIPNGFYLARDIWLYKSKTIPTPMAIVWGDNEGYTSFEEGIGYDPNNLSAKGCTASISSNIVTCQTGARMIQHNIIGQEVMMTFPVRSDRLNMKFKYISLQ